MNEIIERLRNEPVLVTTVFGAVLNTLIVFGVPITDDQKVALVVLVTAILALFARQSVTPNNKVTPA